MAKTIECDTHGPAFETFICVHWPLILSRYGIQVKQVSLPVAGFLVRYLSRGISAAGRMER